MRILVELTAVGMQGTENTDLHALFSGTAEHGTGGRAEQGIERRPVVVEKGPQQMGHGEGDMLPVTAREDVALPRYPLLRGFETTEAAAF